MDEADIPGMSVATFKGDKLSFFELGYKNIKTLEEVESNTVFQAASLTKVIIATLCLQLYEEQKINLSEPLWRTVPYPKLEDQRDARKITARMVLSHTTGLPNWGGNKLTFRNKPGTRWGYSGEAFVWLGLVLEKISQRSLEELAQERIFGPLEMTGSRLVWDDGLTERVSKAYNDVEIEEPFDRFERVNAAASLWTTARDYAVFMQALINAKILRYTSMGLMFNPRADIEDTDGQLKWGYGIGLELVDGKKAIWHWGDNRLFRCFVFAYPDTKEGFVYFTNSENGLSILGAMLQMGYPGPHPLVDWLNYPLYDSPGQKARKEMKLAFLYKDSTQALQILEEASRQYEPEQLYEVGMSTYHLLMKEKKAETTLPMLRFFLKKEPANANLWKAYASALAHLHRYGAAREAYKRVIAADPDSYYEIKNKFRWLEEGMKSVREKKTVTNLQDYVGQYHELKISLEDGQLYVTAKDRKAPVRLIPLDEQIFDLDDQVIYRYKFELTPDKRIEGVVVYDIDGGISYYPRE